MGQGVWIDSEKLGWDDSVREVLKHGTLTVGFIGLAETLKALIGKHHGESEESQKLGLEIIGHMRKRMDDESAEDRPELHAARHAGRGPFRPLREDRQGEVRHHPGRHRPRLLHQLVPHPGLFPDQRVPERSSWKRPTTR